MSLRFVCSRLVVIVVAGLMVACSSSGTGESLTEDAADVLQARMEAVRSAVDDEDPAAFQEALDALRREAQAQARAGEISEQRLNAIEVATVNASNFAGELADEPDPDPDQDPGPDQDPESDEDPDPTPTPMPSPTPATSTAEASTTDGG